MTNVTMNVSGSNVWWTLSETSVAVLKPELEMLGFDELISEREGIQMLREAIAEAMPQASLVQRTQVATELEIVNVIKGQGGNTYKNHLTVDLEHPENFPVEIAVAYQRRKQVLTPAQVGSILRKLIFKFDGIMLRETGGIYWIPGDQVAKFRQVASIIERAGGGNRVYFQTIVMDVETIRTMRACLSIEIEAEAKKMMEELSNTVDPLGKRAIEHRREQAKEMLAKVRNYEGLLESSLDDLRKSIEEVEIAAAAAALMAASQESAAKVA